MGQEQSTDGNGENFMASMPSGAASMAGADLYDVVRWSQIKLENRTQ